MAWLCAVLMVPLILYIWVLDKKRTRTKDHMRKIGYDTEDLRDHI